MLPHLVATSWIDDFCLLLLPPSLDLEPKLPCVCFLGESSPRALPCDDFSGRVGSLGHSEMCLFICWPNIVMVPRHVPHEVCMVMGVDDVVEECWIVLDGIGAEWAT